MMLDEVLDMNEEDKDNLLLYLLLINALEKIDELTRENDALKQEVKDLRHELSKPERMTDAEYRAHWGIFG